MIPETTEQILFCTFDDCVKVDWLGLLICPLLTLLIEDQFILYMYLRKTYYIFISRYQGHCPTTKYDYGETYGEATTKYFQDYRSRVLSGGLQCYAPRPSPEYSCGKRNLLYPIWAASFVSVEVYLIQAFFSSFG
jgi:hypothetical protein